MRGLPVCQAISGLVIDKLILEAFVRLAVNPDYSMSQPNPMDKKPHHQEATAVTVRSARVSEHTGCVAGLVRSDRIAPITAKILKIEPTRLGAMRNLGNGE
jgi:hypothetical protein